MTLVNMSGTNNGASQPIPSVLQGSSALNTGSNTAMQVDKLPPDPVVKVEPSIKSDANEEGKSSVSVIFTDWIPANETDQDTSTPCAEENLSSHVLRSNPTRYYHLKRGPEKIRPGLGTSIEDIMAMSMSTKSKKRKAVPIMQKLLENSGDFNLNKKFIITPEKPAVSILNEISPNLQYNVQEVKAELGSKALPTFTCTITFPPTEDGTDFFGEGRSKKQAKNDAAEKVLASLGMIIPSNFEEKDVEMSGPSHPIHEMPPLPDLNFRPPFGHMGGQFPHGMPMQTNDLDFASDDIINVNFNALSNPTMLSQPMVDSAVFRRLKNIPNFEDNICLALNTILLPNLAEYDYLGEDGPPHEKIFTVKLRCNMQEYFGEGGSKKKAKADAAKKAVITLLGEDFYKSLVQSSEQLSSPNKTATTSPPAVQQQKTSKKKKKSKKSGTAATDPSAPMEEDEDEDDCDDDWGEYDLNFSDHISNSVREKYEELIDKDSNFSSFKVLAGVVITLGSPMIYNSKVISVTTGTKCIEGDFMSEQGLSVNDCHAEILATRCVRDYLYSQIEAFENAKSDKDRLECILEENTSPDRQSKYQLKNDVKFHLYISTSPCGDARIFSPKGIEIEEDSQPAPTDLEDTHPNKLNRGVLRSKIEAGEGTIPSSNLYNGPQTWDSIVSGNALYTMSCSDKVCRWNVLGIQGALLYNFVGTVFYSSITLGSLHHPVHFKRAVFGRIEPLNTRLQIPFHVNKPKLMMVSREEKRRVKKSPNYAMCWSINWSTPEILAANKGRCEPGGVASRLTKRMAFSRFSKLYKNETGRRDNFADLTYYEAKQVASDYQKAKKEFVDFFMESKLGPWIGKPLEQDAFKIK